MVSTTIAAPRRMEQQDRLDDEARVVALVQVEAALEHHDRASRRACRAAAGRRAPAPSRPASPAAPRTGSRPRPPGRRPGRRARTRGRSRPRARASVRSRTAASSAASRAGCSTGGIGRVGSSGRPTSAGRGRSDMRASRNASRGRRPRPADFVGPTEVSTPGCRSRPVGREPRRRTVVRQPPEPGNEAPEATGGGSKVLDAISGPSVLSAPSGKTYGTAPAGGRVNAVIHQVPVEAVRSYPRSWSAAVDKLWTERVRRAACLSRPSRTSRPSAASIVAAERSSE